MKILSFIYWCIIVYFAIADNNAILIIHRDTASFIQRGAFLINISTDTTLEKIIISSVVPIITFIAGWFLSRIGFKREIRKRQLYDGFTPFHFR